LGKTNLCEKELYLLVVDQFRGRFFYSRLSDCLLPHGSQKEESSDKRSLILIAIINFTVKN
jgi:hypothetical protein